jgi:LuxR family maltose regulon positive regulatory protein
MAETPSGWYAPSLTFLEMQYHMVTGDLAPVRRWSQAQKFDFSDINHHADWYILFARLLVKEGEYARAVEFLQRLIDHFSNLDVPFQVATLLGDQACAYHGLGDMDKALENVSKLVDFGRIELAAVPIYRKGPAMMSLLKSALARGIKADRVRKLLDAIYTLFPQTGESRADGGQFLPQHLTERELDVLKLLDSGRSSKAIAKELDIAPSTVRTHIKSIYNKLGVNHRIEALHKAKALKII